MKSPLKQEKYAWSRSMIGSAIADSTGGFLRAASKPTKTTGKALSTGKFASSIVGKAIASTMYDALDYGMQMFKRGQSIVRPSIGTHDLPKQKKGES